MTISISSQNTTSVILTIVVISTILKSIMIEKRYKRFLIPFDSDLEDSIIFINHISRRDKFKRFKHYSSFFTNQNKCKRFYNFTFIIFSNIF